MATTRLIRVREAAVRCGYRPGYGHEFIPTVLPVYRAGPADNSPLCVLESDLETYLAQRLAQPVKGPSLVEAGAR